MYVETSRADLQMFWLNVKGSASDFILPCPFIHIQPLRMYCSIRKSCSNKSLSTGIVCSPKLSNYYFLPNFYEQFGACIYEIVGYMHVLMRKSQKEISVLSL
jgi:hypothetical protein